MKNRTTERRDLNGDDDGFRCFTSIAHSSVHLQSSRVESSIFNFRYETLYNNDVSTTLIDNIRLMCGDDYEVSE